MNSMHEQFKFLEKQLETAIFQRKCQTSDIARIVAMVKEEELTKMLDDLASELFALFCKEMKDVGYTEVYVGEIPLNMKGFPECWNGRATPVCHHPGDRYCPTVSGSSPRRE